MFYLSEEFKVMFFSTIHIEISWCLARLASIVVVILVKTAWRISYATGHQR